MSLVFGAVAGTTTAIISPNEVRLTSDGITFQEGWAYWTDRNSVVPNVVNVSFEFNINRIRPSVTEHGVAFWIGYDGPGPYPPMYGGNTSRLNTLNPSSSIIANPDGLIVAFNTYGQRIVVGWGASVIASPFFTFTAATWTYANILIQTVPGKYLTIVVTIGGIVGLSQTIYGNYTHVPGNYGFVGWTGFSPSFDNPDIRVRNVSLISLSSSVARVISSQIINSSTRSNDVSIQNNQPILDNLLSLSNCAGAYSTRLLFSQYRGPAVRVRRGTDPAAAQTDVWVDADGFVVKLCDVSASGGVDYFHDSSLRAFLASGTLSVQRTQTADVLVVGGGGAGGAVRGGGGGAGGLLFLRNVVLESNQTYRAWVGLGGTTGSTTGENSVFESNVAFGGGFGQGGPGGSGGGACNAGTPGAGFSGQGFSGGLGLPDNACSTVDAAVGGGGGGAGGIGGNASCLRVGGPGGIGLDMSRFFGTKYGERGYFAGGGGGGPAPGGRGGGGAGQTSNNGVDGLPNSGGGGGGTLYSSNNSRPGFGGSGVVLVRLHPTLLGRGALSQWLAGEPATLVRWYDQSGLERHATDLRGAPAVLPAADFDRYVLSGGISDGLRFPMPLLAQSDYGLVSLTRALGTRLFDGASSNWTSGSYAYSWHGSNWTVVVDRNNSSEQRINGTARAYDPSAMLYSFSTFTFTNAQASGRTGPTLAQCRADAAYAAQAWASNDAYFGMTLQGVQRWTVPGSGLYEIEAAGARGGNSYAVAGGAGQVLSGTFELFSSEILHVVVGQMGSDNSNVGISQFYGGGGGGTFVFRNAVSADSILLAAGGGGGAGLVQSSGNPFGYGRDGGSFAPTPSNYQVGGAGGAFGSGGAGGSNGNPDVLASANGFPGTNVAGGNGGAGFVPDVGAVLGYTYSGGGGGGGMGLSNVSSNDVTFAGGTSPAFAHGGFGGGGGAGGSNLPWRNADGGGGGGGGYSGGGGGTTSLRSGGGGGSIIDLTSALEYNESVGARSQHGYVRITKL